VLKCYSFDSSSLCVYTSKQIGWLSGNTLVSVNVVTMSGPVSTWMGDH